MLERLPVSLYPLKVHVIIHHFNYGLSGLSFSTKSSSAFSIMINLEKMRKSPRQMYLLKIGGVLKTVNADMHRILSIDFLPLPKEVDVKISPQEL